MKGISVTTQKRVAVQLNEAEVNEVLVAAARAKAERVLGHDPGNTVEWVLRRDTYGDPFCNNADPVKLVVSFVSKVYDGDPGK